MLKLQRDTSSSSTEYYFMYTCVFRSAEFYLRPREATMRIAYRFLWRKKSQSYNVGTALFCIDTLPECRCIRLLAFACSRDVSVERGLFGVWQFLWKSSCSTHSWVYLHDFNRVYLYKLSAILRFWRRSKLPWNSTRTIKLYIMHFVLSWTFRFGAQNESLSHHHHPPSRKIIRVLFSKQENNQKFKRIALANCSKPPSGPSRMAI